MPDPPGNQTNASQTCIFCRIIRGEEQASIVFEDSHSVAFLDHRPLFPGHCLLVPRAHYERLSDLPASLVGPLFQNAQLLERAIEEGLAADGTFVALNNRVSQSVPHVHIHLVPRHYKDGLKGFFWPRQRYQDEATLRQVQDALRAALERLSLASSPRADEQHGASLHPSRSRSSEQGSSEPVVQYRAEEMNASMEQASRDVSTR